MAEAEALAVEEQQIEGQGLPDLQEEGLEQEVGEQVDDVNHNEEIRKWQSLYDKSQAENAKMQNAMTDYLKSQTNTQQAQSTQPQLTEDEFNPWDAYYKPDSPSYKMRVQNESSLVHSVLDKEIQRMESNMTMNNTRNELRQVHNMNDNDIDEFMSFVSKPKDKVPVSTLVRLWRDTSGRSGNQPNTAIPQTRQQAPRTAGTQNSQTPVRKSEEAKIWESVLKSTGVTNKLP